MFVDIKDFVKRRQVHCLTVDVQELSGKTVDEYKCKMILHVFHYVRNTKFRNRHGYLEHIYS